MMMRRTMTMTKMTKKMKQKVKKQKNQTEMAFAPKMTMNWQALTLRKVLMMKQKMMMTMMTRYKTKKKKKKMMMLMKTKRSLIAMRTTLMTTAKTPQLAQKNHCSRHQKAPRLMKPTREQKRLSYFASTAIPEWRERQQFFRQVRVAFCFRACLGS